MSFRLASINARGLAARERSIELCHFLRQHRVDVAFIQETNVSSLDAIQHLCLGYSAVIVPPAALRGSGLACLFASGVAVLRQRVLWPGNISIVSIDVRGQEVRVINCHLSHIPRERLEQLESIKAAAIQEDAWVVDDLNIDDQSASDTASGSVEALTELMEQTVLVDIATLFDAAHLPARVASCRRRVDTARLDRIILPSRLLERVTLYKTIYYRLSVHRAVLVQLGSPPFPRQPCVAAMLRSVLVDEYLLATIERTAESIADMSSESLWIRWSKIKAEFLAEVRSLHVSSVADDDHISRAGRFLQARLEAASSAADYPSLPDLVRSLRVRRPACPNIRDEDGSIIEGGELRRRAYSIYQRRFARESSDPIAAAEFIRGTTTPPLTLEENDPLIRPVITGAEIAAAIRRLPLGRAPGWDDLPCEFLIAYEDFFVEALRRVFEASKLRGALPSSIRRSTICLVPKSNGGPGLSAYRPISLPMADYRVLGNILLQRLRPHLPVLVPRCQTYAVPGRSPSWNVARIADEIHMATRNGSELAVISTDLESAFDTLDRSFLVSLMVSLRLPSAFIEWFLLLYAGADAAVRAGSLHTKPFHLLNGVRQGCAVSAALFSLAIGPLLVRLERLLGPGNVLAYADDIVLLIRHDELFDVVRNIFEDFRRASLINVNFWKSRGLWCGAWQARTDAQLGISWTSEQLRELGCNVTSAMPSSAQEQHLFALLEGAITRWVPFTRGLSLVGRARAANSLVLSAVVHHLHGYLPTDSTIAKLQARLMRFVWGPQRTAWLPGGVLARPVSVGGLGLLDIGTQLRLACLKGMQAALRGSLNAYSWLAGVQASLRGAANGYSWMVRSRAWLTPPAPDVWHSPRRRRLLSQWEAASSVLELDHRVLHPASLRSLRLRGDNRFLRPPDLLASERWLQATVGDFSDGTPALARSTRPRSWTRRIWRPSANVSCGKRQLQLSCGPPILNTQYDAIYIESDLSIAPYFGDKRIHLGSGQDLCLGYSAVVLAHPVAISGSGLACVFGPGVAVLHQRILWPGHIALATIDVRGEEMTAIAEEEGACWIIGDFNIRDRGPSSSSSSDALAALLDLAALVDVATQFDAAHLPTRVAMHGDQVESNRLDRILVPAGVLDRASIYATSHYHLSDHRLVLLQVGPPTTAVFSPTQPRLAAMLRSGLALEHLAGYIRELEEDTARDDDDGTFWDGWTSIKAGLLAEARSLHDPRHAASDSYVYRARRYIAAQLEASSIRADYTSLPDLARAIRLRRPVSIIRDEEDNVIEGPELRRRAHQPSEIAHAIEHLPRGKPPGWDGFPCELLVAFNEDFFAEALARVFAASRLRGALPPSTRRSSICLVPKARGGRGLDGYRPVALPSADYRVLAAILHRRLKPHLRTLVPECQTYAVPGRSPSWNIAMVTDAVEEATALGSPLAVMGVDLEAWINILYAGEDATIRAGGFYTTAFPLLNGLRQGCAVSAALFSIATGPLLRRLELTLGVGNVIAYADDIFLLFHRDGDFERVATVFEEYKQASGVGVNLRKSAGLWCGAWRNRGYSPLGASWSTISIRVLGLDIAPRSTVAHREQHLLALLETACRRWTPFTRGLSLVGRARAANTLVGSTIQHHLHGYLSSPPTIAKLQARLARFVWGPDHTAWLPANVMARPVAIGGLGLLDLATQLQLACLKGVQVALRGGRNAFSWLVSGNSGEAWIHPPPDGTRLQPRRLRLLKLWEEASNILGLNHRAVPTAQLLDLNIIGGCRFLRPPDLLAPARWSGARVRDLIEEEHLIARPTRSALADAAALGAFCRRLTSENAVGFGAESAPSSSSLAAAVVLRGTATPFLNGLTTRSARRALDRPRLAATPISRFLARWTPTINPPSRIDWASLRRCTYSGHEADAALKLALHALPHPAHPASVGPSCPACGSIDRSLGHRYWCCRSIRPLIRETFNIIGRPPDLQAWIFGGSGLEDDALSILASAKLRIYRYFEQVGLGEAVEDPLIAWSRTLQRRGLLPLSLL
ncbi:hypothetical protein LAZ67_15001018 [Cordylochernes scorpioides]|uniref:Reverse transcriptase domain-containing protein n=1 Tax=Cordylochernes scorpioides TaxID=51811 RepID=A0ABY6L9J2_9ARAC|nr:hypothetical protein LAZ67_15001018 [Cordylochernes scorpioides]